MRAGGGFRGQGGADVVSSTMTVAPAALECRICHARYPVEPLTICEECFGPLEPSYDLDAIDGAAFRQEVEAGPASMWRYQPLLPGGPDVDRVDLGAGFTPLRRADNLAARLGLERLWIKDDSVNPSNSFKDRVVSVATTIGRAFGFEAISCASTGNLANATAARREDRYAVLRVRPRRSRAREDPRDRDLRREGHRGEGQLRRRQPALLRGRRGAAMGVRQRQHAAVLR